MYGEVEGDAPHEDQSELEPLHLPGDGPAAPRGRPVLTNTISYSGTMENFLKFNVILFFKGQTQLPTSDKSLRLAWINIFPSTQTERDEDLQFCIPPSPPGWRGRPREEGRDH